MSILISLIHDFLLNLNETELELPFRQLLRTLGHHTIFQRTRHGQGEHGKDIVSITEEDSEPLIYIFQLKVRDVTVNRFRTEIRSEFNPMFEVPINHPRVTGNENKKYVLVSTGNFSRDAATEFHGYNESNLRIGHPEIKLWDISLLSSLFNRHIDSFSIVEPSIKDDLIRIWLDIKNQKYERSEWINFIDALFTENEESYDESILLVSLFTVFFASESIITQNYFLMRSFYR